MHICYIFSSDDTQRTMSSNELCNLLCVSTVAFTDRIGFPILNSWNFTLRPTIVTSLEHNGNLWSQMQYSLLEYFTKRCFSKDNFSYSVCFCNFVLLNNCHDKMCELIKKYILPNSASINLIEIILFCNLTNNLIQ